MPPETKSTTEQTRGPATGEEQAFGGIALGQANEAAQASKNALYDPRTRLANLDNEKQQIRDRITALKQDLYGYIETGDASRAGDIAALNRRSGIPGQIAQEEGNLRTLDNLKPQLEQQAARLGEQEGLNLRVQKRLDDFISGRDIGVSPQEQSLITQGISGISQDVATTRGLNRTDVPVMQALGGTISQALLQQANANRSLFTGINQFQQGMDLSGRQLQAGLAGQNPAANLTGVYAGLRPSSFSTNTQQGYGALDYVNATANLAQGLGQGYAGFTGGLKK